MSKFQIKQVEGECGYHVFIDGKEISDCVTSIRFPVGIQPVPIVPITLNVVGNVDIDLESATVKVKKDADIQS